VPYLFRNPACDRAVCPCEPRSLFATRWRGPYAPQTLVEIEVTQACPSSAAVDRPPVGVPEPAPRGCLPLRGSFSPLPRIRQPTSPVETHFCDCHSADESGVRAGGLPRCQISGRRGSHASGIARHAAEWWLRCAQAQTEAGLRGVIRWWSLPRVNDKPTESIRRTGRVRGVRQKRCRVLGQNFATSPTATPALRRPFIWPLFWD